MLPAELGVGALRCALQVLLLDFDILGLGAIVGLLVQLYSVVAHVKVLRGRILVELVAEVGGSDQQLIALEWEDTHERVDWGHVTNLALGSAADVEATCMQVFELLG